jgi:hypothetical protein
MGEIPTGFLKEMNTEMKDLILVPIVTLIVSKGLYLLQEAKINTSFPSASSLQIKGNRVYVLETGTRFGKFWISAKSLPLIQ